MAEVDLETVQWLREAHVNTAAVNMLADPKKGFTKCAFALCTLEQIKEAFPELPQGQLILVGNAMDKLKPAPTSSAGS